MTKLYGYTGKILSVDLSSGKLTSIPTMNYADKYIGGRGIAAKIFWDEVPPEVGAFDPQNRLIFMTGPLAGIPGLGASRWTVCSKSPVTIPDHFTYSNFGGRWGAQLKFAGYDGIVVYGKSDKPVYLFIKDGVAGIKDASHLWGKSTLATREILKGELGEKVAVVACGPAGENGVVFSTLIADNDASGAKGFASVMGAKNLKAIAVMGTTKPVVADPKRLNDLRRYFFKLWEGSRALNDRRAEIGKLKKDNCYGCIGVCNRSKRELEDGTMHKSLCAPPTVFYIVGSMYYGDMNKMPANEIPMRAVKLLDEYGIDVHSLLPIMMWILSCAKAGILTEKEIGLPLSKFGSLEFIEALLKMISYREGFGDILAQGLFQAAESVGKGSVEVLENLPFAFGMDARLMPYCPRQFPAHGLLYAMEPTLPIEQVHETAFMIYKWIFWADRNYADKKSLITYSGNPNVSSEVFRKVAKRFWGSTQAADFSTYEGKAMAAKMIQDRSYLKESLGLCEWLWPALTTNSGDYVGDPSVESKVYSAVTGNNVDEQELYRIGERIFNLRRAITTREGRKGRIYDTIPRAMFSVPLKEGTDNPRALAPGKEGEIISMTGAVVDKDKFETLKDEYYQLRGWDVATGLQTKAKLEELDLQDVAKDLTQRGLLS
ncbi:MAG: aldehyde ferredoxin oxidoreductase N-terminal domain-containing protein [Pseudomonadota bacterium]